MSDKQTHLYELTRDLADKWSENAEQHITEKVNSVLDGKLKELILTVCGFEHSSHYHHWKVDHCNNRSGNSPVGQLINDAVSSRLTQIIGKLELTQDEINDMRREAKKAYLSEYRSQILQKSRHLAEQHAKEFTNKTIGSALEGKAEAVRLRLMGAD